MAKQTDKVTKRKSNQPKAKLNETKAVITQSYVNAAVRQSKRIKKYTESEKYAIGDTTKTCNSVNNFCGDDTI